MATAVGGRGSPRVRLRSGVVDSESDNCSGSGDSFEDSSATPTKLLKMDTCSGSPDTTFSDLRLRNRGALLRGPKNMSVELVPLKTMSKYDVLLEVHSVGICGSDIKYWQDGKCGRFKMREPMIIGHEASGLVIDTGPGVTTLKKGDKVAIEPGVPCRVCLLCKSGKYNLCPDIRFCATPPVHGNLCNYFTHPADFCHKLPDTMTMDEGALIEPLAVAVYGCERGDVKPGTNVLICGSGPVGLLAMMAAKAMGANKVMITDIDEQRLALAKSLGADYTLDVSMCDGDVAGCVTAHFIPDVTLECSGVDESMNLGINVTMPGGSLVLIGRGSMEPRVPLVKAATFQIDIKGVFRYANCYPKAISLVESGKVNVRPLITHRFNLDSMLTAFETAKERVGGSIKVIVYCN